MSANRPAPTLPGCEPRHYARVASISQAAEPNVTPACEAWARSTARSSPSAFSCAGSSSPLSSQPSGPSRNDSAAAGSSPNHIGPVDGSNDTSTKPEARSTLRTRSGSARPNGPGAPAGGPANAVKRGEERACRSIQIFNQSPRAWRARIYSDEEIAAFHEAMKDAETVEALVIHAVYLLNCASEDPEIRDKSLAALAFVLLVGLSRVYLGVHYPSDILGGWAAGMAWVVGVYAALYRNGRPWKARLQANS